MTASYCDVAYGDIYFETRYPSSVWDAASDADKLKALYQATALIDNLSFTGDKYDSDQELEFPRGDDTEIPTNIKKAACELAYALLDGADPEMEAQSIFQTASVFDVVRITRHQNLVPTRILHGIVSMYAWNLLQPFLKDPSSITLSRSS